MGNRERIWENVFPEVSESFKESDALALQGVSKTLDQGLEIDSRIDFPSFQLLVNVDEQSGRLFRGSFQVGSHLPIVFKERNRVQVLPCSGRTEPLSLTTAIYRRGIDTRPTLAAHSLRLVELPKTERLTCTSELVY